MLNFINPQKCKKNFFIKKINLYSISLPVLYVILIISIHLPTFWKNYFCSKLINT